MTGRSKKATPHVVVREVEAPAETTISFRLSLGRSLDLPIR
jgi:hypothetical protein